MYLKLFLAKRLGGSLYRSIRFLIPGILQKPNHSDSQAGKICQKNFKHLFTEAIINDTKLVQKHPVNLIYYPEEQKINLLARLDTYLGSQTGFSRSFVQKSIKAGSITVNGQIVQKTGYQLQAGMQLGGFLSLPESKIKPENIPLTIVYQDKHLAVINKPAGLIVHPTTYLREGTLVNALLHQFPEQLSRADERPGIVHRLDKDTSGLMVIAKNNQAHEYLAAQLQDRSLSRIYQGITFGNFTENKGFIEAPIGRHKVHRKKMTVRADGRQAGTHWQVLQQFAGYTLLKLKLTTGRTHQIRVHLEYINRPLLGDPMYGGKKNKIHKELLKRQALHAGEIGFRHPVSQERMHFKCPLPTDLQSLLHYLVSNNAYELADSPMINN